ncbi:MAG TPA: universal stress protein [Casimicrobiaceae bacterium]|nr:universal stress protein [Casimicrobiaceae bacterium]
MYAHFLVPTDGSKLSDKAVAHAIALAKATQARITMFHATPGFPRPVYADGISVEMVSRREYAKQAKEDAAKVLDRAAAKAKAAGIACETMHASTDAPWEAILAAAKKAKADTIVMASHGRRGIVGLLLGSETTKVLTHSTLPVLVVR